MATKKQPKRSTRKPPADKPKRQQPESLRLPSVAAPPTVDDLEKNLAR